MSFNVGDLLIATGPNNCRSLTKTELLALLGISGGTETFIKKFKQNDGLPINNSIVLVPDPDLFFPIGANEIWKWEVVLFYNIISNGTYLNFDFTGPASPTILKIYPEDLGNDDNFVITAFSSDYGTYAGRGLTRQGVDPGLNGGTKITGFCKNGVNAGTIQLRLAQYAAVAEDTKDLAGSYLIAHRIG